MTEPHSPSSTPVSPSDPAESEPKRSRWADLGFFGAGALLGLPAGLFLGVLGFLAWVRGWTFSDLNMTVAAQPLATVFTGLAAIGAASLALYNGNKTRENDRANQEVTRQHDKDQREAAEKHAVALQEEAAKRDTERSLRDRFFKITETLSEGTNYVKREAGVYALVALADDWAAFHRDNPDATKREQQTCLNVIAGQLRDPLSITSPSPHHGPSPAGSTQNEEQPQHDPALLTFKHRVQDIILERFRASGERKIGVWSHLNLGLSNCHLHGMSTGRVIVQGEASFDNTHFHNSVSFDSAKFEGSVSFNSAKFEGDAWYDGTEFEGSASFIGAEFKGDAWFAHEKFKGNAWFDHAKFKGAAWFTHAKFERNASFHSAEFKGDAWFAYAKIESLASFTRATFEGSASFGGASFNSALFRRATFERSASFGGASFNSGSFYSAHFHDSALFNRAEFHGRISFELSHFCSTFTWREVDGHESQIDFKDVHFRADKATVLKENDSDVFEKIVEDAVFSAGCPFDSPEETA